MTKKKKGRNKNAQERAAGAGAVWDAASAEKSRADPHTSADIASAAPDSCAEVDSLRRALKAATMGAKLLSRLQSGCARGTPLAEARRASNLN